jgi:hypothetical protein
MSGTREELASGIDLHSLGWEELRGRFDVPENVNVDMKVDDSLKATIQRGSEILPDGTSGEVLVLGAAELLGDGKALVHMFRVVEGVLTQASTLTFDPAETNKETMQKLDTVYDEERGLGLLTPSPDDALDCIGYLGRICGKLN